MGRKSCAVENCANSIYYRSRDISFYSVAKRCFEFRCRWLEFCEPWREQDFDELYICSDHFVREDFRCPTNKGKGTNAMTTRWNSFAQQENLCVVYVRICTNATRLRKVLPYWNFALKCQKLQNKHTALEPMSKAKDAKCWNNNSIEALRPLEGSWKKKLKPSSSTKTAAAKTSAAAVKGAYVYSTKYKVSWI